MIGHTHIKESEQFCSLFFIARIQPLVMVIWTLSRQTERLGMDYGCRFEALRSINDDKRKIRLRILVIKSINRFLCVL